MRSEIFTSYKTFELFSRWIVGTGAFSVVSLQAAQDENGTQSWIQCLALSALAKILMLNLSLPVQVHVREDHSIWETAESLGFLKLHLGAWYWCMLRFILLSSVQQWMSPLRLKHCYHKQSWQWKYLLTECPVPVLLWGMHDFCFFGGYFSVDCWLHN